MNLRREVVSHDGRRTAYVTLGDGPTIVMLPGERHTLDDWAGTGYLARYAGAHRLIGIDLGPDVLDSGVARVTDVLEEEAVSAAVLWGLEKGGEVALAVARRRPGLASALICGALPLAEVLKPRVPMFAYWASGEPFAAQNSRTAETMAIESAVIPGSPEESFTLLDRVAVGVDRFLDNVFRG
jgi:pimeloyl-ACP methyl ester carboxylesterase